MFAVGWVGGRVGVCCSFVSPCTVKGGGWRWGCCPEHFFLAGGGGGVADKLLTVLDWRFKMC